MTSARELALANDSIESSMDWNYKGLNGDAVRLWIAAKLRVARLSPSLNEEVLWDPQHSLYDQLLDRKLPLGTYQWMNRHMAFSEYEADREEQRYDRYRKRRIITDMVNQILPKVYYPHQDVGLDEKVRVCFCHSHMFVALSPGCLVSRAGAVKQAPRHHARQVQGIGALGQPERLSERLHERLLPVV